MRDRGFDGFGRSTTRWHLPVLVFPGKTRIPHGKLVTKPVKPVKPAILPGLGFAKPRAAIRRVQEVLVFGPHSALCVSHTPPTTNAPPARVPAYMCIDEYKSVMADGARTDEKEKSNA